MDPGSPNVKPSVTAADSDTGSAMASPGTSTMDELGNDAEGIWSPDIEQSFQEALAIYPPCGRRKIILSDEGKMYGRNELIARYIKLRTGKTRSRKQVSSHIQVLSRRKAKEVSSYSKDPGSKESVLQTMPAAQITTAAPSTTVPNKPVASSLPSPPASLQIQATNSVIESPVGYAAAAAAAAAVGQMYPSGFPPQLWTGVTPTSDPAYYLSAYSFEKPLVIVPNAEVAPPWRDRSIVGPKLRLVELSAFVERQHEGEAYNEQHLFVHIGNNVTYSDPVLESVDIRQIADKFPDKTGGLRELFDKGPQSAFFLVKFWADINTEVTDEMGSFYGVSNLYESTVDMVIQCSTKVCSFGKQVVEKIETEYSLREGSHFIYRIERSPMCEYLVNFIHKLKHLPKKYMMNSVLENFTILQVVTNKDTQETLLCIAYVFEVSTSEHGTQHNIYRLIKE